MKSRQGRHFRKVARGAGRDLMRFDYVRSAKNRTFVDSDEITSERERKIKEVKRLIYECLRKC